MADKRKQFDGELPDRDISVKEAATRIFNLRADEGYEGRVVAEATSIDEIWADVKQPRRAVPASIRLHWNGNPEGVAELLNQWYMVAKKISPINLYDILQGRGEGIDIEDAPAIFTEYLALLRLAASIAKDGLINPISIIQQDGRNLIETGERRWLAYHLLNMNMGTTDWARIPATRANAKDSVWRQATENTQRRQLNAIGMARQIALLVMESRRGLDGQEYNDFDELVLSGECDRRFYAQVANGNIHRIPRGMGERITAAMGELSMGQLRHYRSLLKLTEDDVVNDALWVKADVEGWAEQMIRDTVTIVTVSTLKSIVTRPEWGLDDLRQAMQAAREIKALVPPSSVIPPILQTQPQDRPYVPQLEDRVRVPAGHIGTVVEINGALIHVQTVNSLKPYYAENLDLMARTGPLEDKKSAATPVPTKASIQRVNLEDYPAVLRLTSWSARFRALRMVRGDGELLFVQTAYGQMTFDPAIAYNWLSKVEGEYRVANTDYGQAFFAHDYRVLRELAEHNQVSVYVDSDSPGVNRFWVKMMDTFRSAPPAAPQVESDEEFEQPVRWMPETVGNPESVTDKADSVTPTENVSGYIPPNDHFYIIGHGTPEWQFLNAMREAAKLLEDRNTEKMMTELITMTSTQVQRWSDSNILEKALGMYYDQMLQVIEEWQEVRLQGVLHQIQTGGRDA